MGNRPFNFKSWTWKIPWKIIFDKEYLYDQALQSKIQTNNFKDQNWKILVRLKFLERELEKRDQVIDDLLKRPPKYTAYSSPNIVSKKSQSIVQRSMEGSLITNLKRKNTDLQKELRNSEKLIQELKMDARGTKIRELTMEKQAYETECKRLRVMLETVVGGLKMSEVGDIREFA